VDGDDDSGTMGRSITGGGGEAESRGDGMVERGVAMAQDRRVGPVGGLRCNRRTD
jgi:hypothetical protein